MSGEVFALLVERHRIPDGFPSAPCDGTYHQGSWGHPIGGRCWRGAEYQFNRFYLCGACFKRTAAEFEDAYYAVVERRQEALAQAERENHVIYFAVARAADHEHYGLVKIGRSTNLAMRMANLKTEALASFAGPAYKEGFLHQRFASDRLTGEWFTPSDRLCRFVSRLKPARDPFEWRASTEEANRDAA